jgi:small subunit ribosomal protein S6
MKAYELLFFVDPVIEDEAREALLARIEATITNQGGSIDSIEPWGKRKLAFEVNKLQDGDYTLINFHADPTSIAELDRVLRITDTVVRFIVVRKDQTE